MKTKNGISLWVSGTLLAFALFTTAFFWMSPLGLGFHEPAVEKLNYPFVHEAFLGIYWAGPIGLILAILSLLYLGVSKRNSANFKNTIFYGLLIMILTQISMLAFLSI